MRKFFRCLLKVIFNSISVVFSFFSVLGFSNEKEELLQKVVYFEEVKESFCLKDQIPKVLHVIWIGPKNFPIDSLLNLQSWIECHPDYTYIFWTDRDRVAPLDLFEVRSIKELDLQKWKTRYDSSTSYAEKSDVLRYLILKKFGGIYLDHDAYCLKSFEELNRKADFYIGVQSPHEPIDGLSITAGIGIIGSIPNHPIIENVLNRIEENWDRVTEKFSLEDPVTKYQLVMHRTYVHMTHALKELSDQPSYTNLILPDHYFYPGVETKGVYSRHLYANSWYFHGQEKKEKENLKKLEQVQKQLGKVFFYLILIFTSFILLVVYLGWVRLIKK